MLYNDAVHAFLRAKRGARRSPRTIDWYECQLNHFANWLQQTQRDADLASLDAFTIDHYLADSAPLVSDASLFARFSALRVLFNWLIKRQMLDRNPLLGVDEPRVAEKPIDHVTPAEYEQLLNSITGDSWIDNRDRLLIALLFWTGLRASEITALTETDIYVDRRILIVRKGKGQKTRVVPLPSEILALLLDYLWSRPPTNLTTLWTGRNGAGRASDRPFTRSGLQQMLRRRCKRIGLRNLHPHLWRHGYGTNMLNAGADIGFVQSVLGHSSIKTTKRYAKYLEDGLLQQFDATHGRLTRNT